MQVESANIYVPYSNEDERWGMYVLDVGKSRTPPGSVYPVGAHPPDYIFNFNKGRVLHEYQVLYISEGEGVFESRSSGKIRVETGSILLIYPGEWHRYRPDKSTGWRESWIGFNGIIADHIFTSSDFSKKKPVIRVGLHSRLNQIYDQVLVECRQSDPGYQQVVSGMVMELLGLIQMFRKTITLNNRYIQSQIYKARMIIEDALHLDINPVQIADEVGMGYSNFRKNFRLYTGLSPGQYIIHLRIREAKELLFNTNLTVKMIAEKAGFNSSYYFIRIFREKVGMTPGLFRQRARGLDQQAG